MRCEALPNEVSTFSLGRSVTQRPRMKPKLAAPRHQLTQIVILTISPRRHLVPLSKQCISVTLPETSFKSHNSIILSTKTRTTTLKHIPESSTIPFYAPRMTLGKRWKLNLNNIYNLKRKINNALKKKIQKRDQLK